MEFVTKINKDNLAGLKNKRSDHPQYLRDLVTSLSVCIENYNRLVNEAGSQELKDIGNKLALERSEFMLLLVENFSTKRRNSHDALGKIKPLWTKLIKDLIHSKGDQTMIDIILASEATVLKRYNTYLYHHIPTVEQLNLLVEQKTIVAIAVDLFKSRNNLHVQSMSFLEASVA